MADEKKQSEQKRNQNGKSVLVISDKSLEDAAKVSDSTATTLGYLTAGTKVIDKNNFSWDLFHSKNPPSWGIERLKTAKNIKMYVHNSETNRVFQGNQHRGITNVGSVTKRVDKVAGILGNSSNFIEVGLAVNRGDEKALATKSSTMVISTGTERASLAKAGKCAKFAGKKVDPKKVAIAGAACYVASHYAADEMSEKAGNRIGETEKVQEVASGVLKGIDIMEEQDRKAEGKRIAEAEKKDPMLRWHIVGAD